MMRHPLRNGLAAFAAPMAAAFLLAGAAPALAQDSGSNSGSGLSPSASATGNDRSAGVNNGNYRRPGGYGSRRGYRRPAPIRPRSLLRGRAHRY